VNGHLTAAEIESYRARRLDPAALLAADDHLASCTNCRERAAQNAPSFESLRRSFDAGHLTEEQLRGYAEGRLADAEAAAHLDQCPRCREDAEDLRNFVRQASPPAKSRVRWIIPVGLAAAACLAWWIASPRPHPQFVPVAQTLPDDLRRLRDEAAASGKVAVPPAVAALAGERGTLLGSHSANDAALEAPIATAVLVARPEFRWKAVPGAASYEVSVFDPDFHPVFSSGPTQALSWTPQSDLQPGKTYLWQLTATAGGRNITAPRPPAPEARFLVLPADEQARMADLAARFPSDHVLLGVLYARAGALDEARREWRIAVSEGHSEAARLLQK
jgi:hypothetical protein